MPPPWRRKRTNEETRKARIKARERILGMRPHDWRPELYRRGWWHCKCGMTTESPGQGGTCGEAAVHHVMET